MSLKSKGIGGHHRPFQGKTDEWLTPPSIIKALGGFDLDPCCPQEMPWRTAGCMISAPANGLAEEWYGRVWLNPPYGPETGKWLEKLAIHGNGIALVFARTETEMFHRWGWSRASGMLFLRGRIHFHFLSGDRAAANAGAPSVLIAYGAANVASLAKCSIEGRLIHLI